MAEDIHWQERPFAELRAKAEYGCIITNPPYGERMGDDAEIEQLYQTFPLVLRRLPTWSHYILSARPDLEALVGQRADRRRKLYNGPLECTYYQFHGPRPPRRRRSRRWTTRRESTDDETIEVAIDTRDASNRRSSSSRSHTKSPSTREAGRRSRVWRVAAGVRAAGRRVCQSVAESGAPPSPLADEARHHLLPAVRARRARCAAGGRSLRRRAAPCRVRPAARPLAGTTCRLARPDGPHGRRSARRAARAGVSEASRSAARGGAVPARR